MVQNNQQTQNIKGQRTVYGHNNIQNSRNDGIFKNSQNYAVTVQTQEKLHQRSISQTNIASSKNTNTIDSSQIGNYKISKQTSVNNEQSFQISKQSTSNINSVNNSATKNNLNKEQIQYDRAMLYQRIEDIANQQTKNIVANQIENQNTLSSNSNKSDQDSTLQSKSQSIDKQRSGTLGDFQFQNEQQNNQVKNDPIRINLQIVRKQTGSKDISPHNREEIGEQYSPFQFQKIQLQTSHLSRKSSPIRYVKAVQKPKHGESKRAIDTIQFCNPYLLNNWFNKKANKNSDIKSSFITMSQLQDVMPDIDQNQMSLQQYKLRKLKELNINDQKQQWEDLQQWMRNSFDSCYSRNSLILNSIQKYIYKLEDNYKNNINFRQKLGQLYKSEMIKNNLNSYETSSLIIQMQKNKYIIKQKKQNKNKSEVGSFESIKYKSENNLDDFMSPVSKKSKGNRFSIQSTNNLDTSINLAQKLQNVQQDDEVNSFHQIKEEEETASPTNQITNRQNNNDKQKNEIDSWSQKLEQQNNIQEFKNNIQEKINKNQGEQNRQQICQNSIQQEQIIYRNQQIQNQDKQTNGTIKLEKVLAPRQNQQTCRSYSPQKITNNNINDYDLKTKIIKLQSNYFIRAFIQPNKVSSLQLIQDFDQEDDNNYKNIGCNDFEKNKSCIIPENIQQPTRVNNISNINQEQEKQQINTQNQSNNQFQKVKQSIIQKSENNLFNNNSQLTQRYLSKSLSKTAYSSKIQKEKNILYRMGVQQTQTKKQSDPSINPDILSKQPSNDINQQFSFFLQLKKSEESESCSDQYKSGRATPISSKSQKDSGTFSSQISNIMRNNQQVESPAHNLKKTSNEIKDKVLSLDKKNSTCATPFYNDRQNEQKNSSQIQFKHLFSEKFKLLVSKTSHPTKICDFEQNSDIKRETIYDQRNSHIQNNEKFITNIESTDLNRYIVQKARKTKRSESAATVRYTENRENLERKNYCISQAFCFEENKQRGSVDTLQQEQNNIQQNSQSASQENNEISHKDFIKLIQNPNKSGMMSTIKQQTRNHSFQQGFTNVQMNRSLLQSQQIRRQNNNQMYFQSYFLNNKLQTQPSESLKTLNQENPQTNNQIQQHRMSITFYEKTERKNKSSQRQSSQSDRQSIIPQQKILSQTSLKKDLSEDISPSKLQIKVKSIIPEDKKQFKYQSQIKNRDSNSDISKQNYPTKLSEIRSIVVKGTSQVLGIGNMINKK